MRRPSHGTVVAYLALTLAMSGTAYAATGGTFILGQTNKANRPSKLVNTKSGPALTLRSQPGSAPLSVSKNRKRVANLNADLLDGVHASALQRRVTGTCAGSAITSVKAKGTVTCSTPNSTVYWAVVIADGTLARGSTGVSSSKVGTGTYNVLFPVDVSGCAYTATVGTAVSGSHPAAQTSVAPLNGDPNGVFLQTANNGANSDLGSHVIVAC